MTILLLSYLPYSTSFHLTTSTHWYIRCVLSLFLAFGLGSSVALIVKRRLKGQLENGGLGNGVRLTWKRLLLVITGERVARQTTKAWLFVLGVTLGCMIGYGYRDHQLVDGTREYTSGTTWIAVTKSRYLLYIPGLPKPYYDVTFCAPVQMPAPVVDIKWEQHFGCKDVNGLGYLTIHKENNNATATDIPHGRNSASAPKTTAGLE